MPVCIIGIFIAGFGALSNKLVENVQIINGIPVAIYGPWYKFFSLFFLFSVISTTVIIYFKYKNTNDVIQRQQSKYFLIGLIATIILGVSTNLLIPLFTGVNYYSQFGWTEKPELNYNIQDPLRAWGYVQDRTEKIGRGVPPQTKCLIATIMYIDEQALRAAPKII